MEWRKIENSRKILMISWIVSILFMLPMIIFSDISISENYSNFDNQSNFENKSVDNHKQPRPTCTLILPENGLVQTDFAFVIYGIFVSFLIPVIMISIFYICVLRRLSQRKRQNLSSSSEKDKTHRKVTILVLAVVGVYIGTHTPFWINQIVLVSCYSLVQTPSGLFQHTMTRLSTIFQILLSMNSALNPYLYAFLSETFRESFKIVFQCLIPKCLEKTIRIKEQKNLFKKTLPENNTSNAAKSSNSKRVKKIDTDANSIIIELLDVTHRKN
jgi:hypothetical protein